MNRFMAADDLRREYQVVVAGGGIAGSALFYELSRRGVKALLLERAERPAGASAVPAALLNPYRGRTARARQLDLDGLRFFWRLAARLREAGRDPGTHAGGVLRIASNARQANSWRKLAEDDPNGEQPLTAAATAGPAAAAGGAWLEWFTSQQFPAPYHAPFGGIRVVNGGRVEPAKLLAALIETACSAGGRAVFGRELSSWRRDDDGGLILDVSSTSEQKELADPRRGNVVRTRELVLCLGAYDPQVCRLPRLEAATGLALTLSFEGSVRNGELLPPLAGAIGLIPQDGRLHLVGGALRSPSPSTADLGEAAENLRRAGSWYLPSSATANVEARWHGTRVRRPTGTPVVRRLAPAVTLFGGLAGRGFLSGPLLAERLAASLAARLAPASKN